jgi:hypothetical protein
VRILRRSQSKKTKCFKNLKQEKQFWLIALDHATDFGWSFFLKKKSEAAERIISFIQELKVKDKRTVKFIRCDDGGENIAIENMCKEKALNVLLEYTDRVKRKLATLYGRIRASYYHASIKEMKELCCKLNKCTYGLVQQSARMFFKKLARNLKTPG